MLILGIETSCDETAAAVVEDGVRILSNVVVSQIDIFAEYGGVIPEVAARSHLEVVLPVIDKAMSDAGVSWEKIDAIAVTHAPGLLGSLLIGTLTARTLAILHNKPLYAVHHLKSHVYVNWLSGARVLAESGAQGLAEPIFSDAGLEFLGTSYAGTPAEPPLRGEPVGSVRNIRVKNSNHFMHPKKQVSATRTPDSIARTPVFPLLAMVISGGHTQILRMIAHNQFEIVGTTRDDAVGECFDKVAKILGLPYPGGPSIAKATEGLVESAFSSAGLENPGTSYAGTPAEPPASQANLSGTSGIYVPEFSNHFMLQKKQISTRPGDPSRYTLPHPKVEGLDFSFSGLKTAVLRAVQKEVGVPISYPSHKLAELLSPQQVADFAASFQETAVEILLEKLEMALEQFPDTKSVVFAGGVSANEALRARVLADMSFRERTFSPETSYAGHPGKSALRAAFSAPSGIYVSGLENLEMSPRKTLSATRAINCFFPQPSLSGDNGAMVGAAAYYEIASGVEPTDPYKLNIYPRVNIS